MTRIPSVVALLLAASCASSSSSATASPLPPLYSHLLPFLSSSPPTPYALLSSIHTAVASGAGGFTVPPGLYNFTDSTTFPSSELPLIFDSPTPFHLDCTGAAFLLRPGQGITITNATGVFLNGLTVDFYPLPFTQGVVSDVVAGNYNDVTFTITIDPDYPPLSLPFFEAPTGTGKTIFWNASLRTIFHVQSETSTVVHSLKPLKPNVWQVTTIISTMVPPSTGALCTISPVQTNTLTCLNCANSTFEDVTLYASAGMGYLEAGGAGGNTLRRWRNVRPPESSRLLASNLDAVHSTSVSRGVTFVDSEVSYAADDLFAVHCELGIAWGVPSSSSSSSTEALPASSSLSSSASPITSLYIVDTGGAAPTVAQAQPGQVLYFYALNTTMDPLGSGVVSSVTVVANATLQAEAANAAADIKAELHLTIRNISGGSLLVRVDFDDSYPLPPAAVAPRFSSMVQLRERCGDGTVVRNVSLHDSTGGMRLKGVNVTVDSVQLERAYGMRMLPEVFWTQSVSQDVTVENSVLIDVGNCPAQMDPIAYNNDTCQGCVLRNNTIVPA
jgi:hypothetical protein